MNHFLSVCIPTYNRCEILKDSIEGILPSLINNNIEVCISNNASTDGTDLYLRDLVKRYPQIKYQKQLSNVGIDKNMIDVVKMATGNFILPMGDDDKIILLNLENELARIDEDFDIYVLNGLHKEENHLPKCLIGKSYSSPEIAFRDLWDRMPFGSFIFNKNLFDEKYFNKYLNTSHAYTGILWESLFDGYILKKKVKVECGVLPLIEFKQVEKTWRKDAFKIRYYEIPLWFNLLTEKYEVIDKEKLLDNYLKGLVNYKLLLNEMMENLNYNSNVNEFMRFFNQRQVNKAKIIGFLSHPILRIVLRMLRFIKRLLYV